MGDDYIEPRCMCGHGVGLHEPHIGFVNYRCVGDYHYVCGMCDCETFREDLTEPMFTVDGE